MPDTEISDALLTVRCQLGDEAAWELLVQRWHPRLWRFIVSMVSDRQTAEDILQTVWLRVVRSLIRLRQPERLPAWLYRVARCAVADQLRDRYREPSASELFDVPEDDEEPWLEAADQIESGLGVLHPLDRETVVLHYLQGLSVADVAEVCSVPPGTVKSRLSRARRNLREHLSKD